MSIYNIWKSMLTCVITFKKNVPNCIRLYIQVGIQQAAHMTYKNKKCQVQGYLTF